MEKELFLSVPHMVGTELQYVSEAMNENVIAPLDNNINRFENEVSQMMNVASAAAVSTGTAAIHMALKAAGVQEGDIVFCSSFTFAGSANPIMYLGATPVFIDSDPETYNMSSVALEKALKECTPKAIVVVNIFGGSANFDAIRNVCAKYAPDAVIVEDAAESIGTYYKGKASGTLGDYGIYSFNTNKMITTSGGGMVVSNNEEMIKKIRFWVRQSKDPDFYYKHTELGYNYRMNNAGAGIGRAQLQDLKNRVMKKKEIRKWYVEAVEKNSDLMFVQPDYQDCDNCYWLNQIYFKKEVDLVALCEELKKHHIEARAIWKPMHLQPYYENYKFFSHFEDRSFCEEIYTTGICVPSDIALTKEDVERVVALIAQFIG